MGDQHQQFVATFHGVGRASQPSWAAPLPRVSRPCVRKSSKDLVRAVFRSWRTHGVVVATQS